MRRSLKNLSILATTILFTGILHKTEAFDIADFGKGVFEMGKDTYEQHKDLFRDQDIYHFELTQDSWNKINNTDISEKISGKNVLLFVHEYASTPDSVLNLAKELEKEVMNVEGEKKFDVVTCFNYMLAELDDSGSDFAKTLNNYYSSANSITVVAMGAGGLVARYAIEKKNAGEKVKNLVTIFTPHKGIQSQEAVDYFQNGAMRNDIQRFKFTPIVLTAITAALTPNIAEIAGFLNTGSKEIKVGWSDVYFDKYKDKPSEFLQKLNEGDSPYKDTINYIALYGTVSKDMPNSNMFNTYQFNFNFGMNNQVKTDGLVNSNSASGSGILDNKSSHYTAMSVESNHIMSNPGAVSKVVAVIADQLEMLEN